MCQLCRTVWKCVANLSYLRREEYRGLSCTVGREYVSVKSRNMSLLRGSETKLRPSVAQNPPQKREKLVFLNFILIYVYLFSTMANKCRIR